MTMAAPEDAAAPLPVGSPGGPEVRQLAREDGRKLAFACLGAPLATARLKCIYYHGEKRVRQWPRRPACILLLRCAMHGGLCWALLPLPRASPGLFVKGTVGRKGFQNNWTSLLFKRNDGTGLVCVWD